MYLEIFVRGDPLLKCQTTVTPLSSPAPALFQDRTRSFAALPFLSQECCGARSSGKSSRSGEGQSDRPRKSRFRETGMFSHLPSFLDVEDNQSS